MRGRQAFSIVRPLMLALTTVLQMLPRFVSTALWRIVNGWAGPLGLGLRYIVAKRLAASIGESVYLGADLEIRNWEGLRVGQFVSIHRGTYIDAVGGVTIGNDVSIAHASSILSFDHTWSDASKPIRDNPIKHAAVTISDDVWVGCGVRILAGVTIGRRCVVAAGAVVAKDVPSGAVAGGVPAKQIGSTN